jgi:chitinase
MVILALNTSCSKKSVTVSKNGDTDNRFKVIGYLPNRTDLLVSAKQIDFAKITHLYIAFIKSGFFGKSHKNRESQRSRSAGTFPKM